MTKAERKRRAARAALGLLQWRDRASKEAADRENAERIVAVRYDRMIAEMQQQAEEFSWRKPATPSPLKSAGFPTANGNGHAGAL